MWRNWVIITLLWSSLILVESKLFELSTKNVAVVVGQPSSIICQSSSTVNINALYFVPLWPTKEFPIWSLEIGTDPKNFTDPISVFKDHSNVTLYIHSTSLNSAGTFTWRATYSSGESVYLNKSIAQLIVLDGKLTCNSSIRGSALQEFESVEMQCNIGYRGNWAPVMEWRISGKDVQVVREGVQTTSILYLSVTSVFKFTAIHTMNNRNVRCKTYFSNYTGKVITTATNIPDYSYTWTSQSLNVTYGPKNANITPVKESYKPGDRLTCSADANPIPIYEWKDMSTFPSFTTGPEYTIPTSVSPFTVECTATNSFGSNSSSVKINVSSIAGLDLKSYLLIGLGAFCLLLILIVVLITGKQIKECQARLNNPEQSKQPGVNNRVQEMDETQASASRDFQGTPAYEDMQPVEPQSLTVYTDLTTIGRVRLPSEGAESDELGQMPVLNITPPVVAVFELEDASQLELRKSRPTQYVNVSVKKKRAHQYVNISEEDVSSFSSR